MIRIMANKISHNTEHAWKDEFHVVRVMTACSALNALYGEGSHWVVFDDDVHGIRKETLRLLAVVMARSEKEAILKDEFNLVDTYFDGFHVNPAKGLSFTFMGRIYEFYSFEDSISTLMELISWKVYEK